MLDKLHIIIVLSIFSTLLISCPGGEMDHKKFTYNILKELPDADWNSLSKKKIYFGHQSVGFNIIDGVKDLMIENPKIKLNIVETNDVKDIGGGALAHSTVGKNKDPKSKIDDFSKYIDQGIGNSADVVALKFCYVDITSDTDINNIFQEYKNKVEELRKSYPSLTIIHFTVPLTIRQIGWKAAIKKIIGRPIGGVADNMKRNEYNELLIKEYQEKDPILDIAKVESSYPDGKRNSFSMYGKTYFSLIPEYTNDGGHLNEIGRKKVAEQFLFVLIAS